MKSSLLKSSKLIFTLSLLWSAVLLFLGAWWVYVMVNFQYFMTYMEDGKMSKMLAWEGGTFLVLLLLLSFSLLTLFLKDQKKTKSLQAFFASLTHELKTPLASIRLQGEVINEILESKNDPTLNKLISRLINDTTKLETQMDKILQLSRIERGGELNLTSVSLVSTINRMAKSTLSDQVVHLECVDDKIRIDADEFALELIIKNLFENTKIHTKSKAIHINITRDENSIYMSYFDNGEFTGDLLRLGNLFYKHNSTKGSGIGLYLTHQLLKKMHADLKITTHNGGLKFNLIFKNCKDSHA